MIINNLGPFKDWEYKDRTFILPDNGEKLESKWIQTTSSSENPMTYFDKDYRVLGEDGKATKRPQTRTLRYSIDHDTPFADMQYGSVRLSRPRFRQGVLHTKSEQVGLQQFMMLHDDFNKKWKLVDKEAEAVEMLEDLDIEFEAQTIARTADITLLESILRADIGSRVDDMTTAEVKKDVRLFAKRNPKLLVKLSKDDSLILRNLAIKAAEAGIIKVSDDADKILWTSNGRKIIDVGFDENPYAKLAKFFKKDEGIELLKTIQAKLKK